MYSSSRDTDKDDEPMLYEVVLRHMIHGPCGEMNVNAPCMNNGTCKKNYLKSFAPCTIQGSDSYPIYQRRDDGRSIALDRNFDVVVDNGWVVPYNPWLLLKYDCHINVEIYSNIKSIKYLYKYVYKGPDCVAFEQAAEKCGLLEEDDSIRQCLIEARVIRMLQLSRGCLPQSCFIVNQPGIFLQHKRSLKEFNLPQIVEEYQDLNSMSGLIEDELTIPIQLDDLNAVSKLNPSQLHAFNIIKHVIMRKQSATFFIDGPGGTGKTFLNRVLLVSFRNVGFIMVATATSGIAAIQLPGGRTAHSKLKIPIKLDSSSRCNFSKQSEVCQLLDRATAILWDEAPIADKKASETVDRTLREMFGVDFPFGGKIMILGDDFHQVVLVVVGGTRSQVVKASIMESYLWSNIKVLHLVDNIRANKDQSFSEFLLHIGNGEEPTVKNNMIRIPNSMVIPFEGH
ncbi:UNVERIFIED_CONTAM: hypothetical protein Scaly_1918600 [Sesamum calycinum]|uniref:ATP-dependent DNA helicase n=1 Tax=Sesamum calycinum TaxID=2727403 RepID=A0AAW2NGB4_9LAMI